MHFFKKKSIKINRCFARLKIMNMSPTANSLLTDDFLNFFLDFIIFRYLQKLSWIRGHPRFLPRNGSIELIGNLENFLKKKMNMLLTANSLLTEDFLYFFLNFFLFFYFFIFRYLQELSRIRGHPRYLLRVGIV